MMLRQDKINALIPMAMEVIEAVEYKEDKKDSKGEVFKIVQDNGVVDKVYEGYIASFGANLNQSGLLPTLVFYQKNKGDGKRILWSKAIYKMLTGEYSKNENDLIKYVIEESIQNGKKDPYTLGDLDVDKLDDLEDKISEIVIALKLAVRTFKIKKNEN